MSNYVSTGLSFPETNDPAVFAGAKSLLMWRMRLIFCWTSPPSSAHDMHSVHYESLILVSANLIGFTLFSCPTATLQPFSTYHGRVRRCCFRAAGETIRSTVDRFFPLNFCFIERFFFSSSNTIRSIIVIASTTPMFSTTPMYICL